MTPGPRGPEPQLPASTPASVETGVEEPSSGSRAANELRFETKAFGFSTPQVWEFDAATKRTCQDVFAETLRALDRPDDFPPIDSAIIAGDRVAIAIDPYVPQIGSIVAAVLKKVRSAGADQIDLVLWDEATAATVRQMESLVDSGDVTVHRSDVRDSLCYLGADPDADPIYLNRALVDADMILPIHAMRPHDQERQFDISGIFPAFADSATRSRYYRTLNRGDAEARFPVTEHTVAQEAPWLLGVQLMLSVVVNAAGRVGEIHAGTIEAIGKRVSPTLRHPDPVPPPATLVIAALDGDAQQQTWANVARAASAATAYANPDATIVIWTSLAELPHGALLGIDSPAESVDDDTYAPEHRGSESDPDDFATWDATPNIADCLRRVLQDHRVMLHSRLPRESVEAIGLGVIDSAAELATFSQHFESCGVLRAAQFAGSSS